MNISITTFAIFILTCSLSTNSVSAFVAPWGHSHNYRQQFTSQQPQSTLLFAQRRGRPRGPVRTIEQKPPMNEEITHDTVRVVTQNPNGKDDTLGIMSKAEALQKASELGNLDLILININSDPPVCKIADYSKYRYMKEKKAKEIKKNSKASELKEVKMSYKIDVHDYEVRKKNAVKFLNQGNRVKCTVMFKGREMQHNDLGRELLYRMADDLSKVCTMDGKPKSEGRNLSCIISPKAEVLKAINDKKRAKEREQRRARESTRKEMEEKMAQKDAVAGAVGGVAVAAAVNDDDEDDDDTLDDLLGGDELMDDLFG